MYFIEILDYKNSEMLHYQQIANMQITIFLRVIFLNGNYCLEKYIYFSVIAIGSLKKIIGTMATLNKND